MTPIFIVILGCLFFPQSLRECDDIPYLTGSVGTGTIFACKKNVVLIQTQGGGIRHFQCQGIKNVISVVDGELVLLLTSTAPVFIDLAENRSCEISGFKRSSCRVQEAIVVEGSVWCYGREIFGNIISNISNHGNEHLFLGNRLFRFEVAGIMRGIASEQFDIEPAESFEVPRGSRVEQLIYNSKENAIEIIVTDFVEVDLRPPRVHGVRKLRLVGGDWVVQQVLSLEGAVDAIEVK